MPRDFAETFKNQTHASFTLSIYLITSKTRERKGKKEKKLTLNQYSINYSIVS